MKLVCLRLKKESEKNKVGMEKSKGFLLAKEVGSKAEKSCHICRRSRGEVENSSLERERAEERERESERGGRRMGPFGRIQFANQEDQLSFSCKVLMKFRPNASKNNNNNNN